MVTRKPYWRDPSPLEGETEVLETRESAEGTWLRLQDSLFYPESGGQRADGGSIGEIPLLDVKESGDERWHLIAQGQDPPIGTVSQRVDEALRREHSEQHSGQHLLSAVLLKLFDAATLSFHMGERVSTVEVDHGIFAPAELARIEARCGDLIEESRPIRIHYPSAEEAAGLPLRKEPSVSDDLRVVEIEQIDWSPCGGTHLESTGQLGAIYLGRQERIRGRQRIEFIAGRRALAGGAEALKILGRLGVKMSCAAAEIEPRIDALQADLSLWRKQALAAASKLLLAEAEALVHADDWVPCASLGRVLLREFGERGTQEMGELARLTLAAAPQACLLWAWREGERRGLLFQRSPGSGENLGAMLRELLAERGGKGGGGIDRAQGALPGVESVMPLLLAARDRLLSDGE